MYPKIVRVNSSSLSNTLLLWKTVKASMLMDSSMETALKEKVEKNSFRQAVGITMEWNEDWE